MFGKAQPQKTLEYDSDALKIVRIGMNHKEAWPIIEQIIREGYRIGGITGNGTGMNQGFVLLEKVKNP